MAKMIDVAKAAGVSVATVSRVLSGDKKVSDETKEKVLRSIKKLNYKPNKLARNLRKLESRMIVAVVPDISNPFFSDIIRGIQKVASQHNYHVLLGDTSNNQNREMDFIELTKERLADGVILLTARIPKEEIVSISKDLPVVLACEYLDGADIPTICIDNISSARKVIDYLVSLGHRRIGFISGPLHVVLSRDRLKGYRQGLLQHGIDIDESLIQEGDFYFQSGYEMAMRLLALDKPPTAIFASNDEMAVGAMKAVKQKALQVPGDVAIVGFDNIGLSMLVEPTLTTVSQPKYEIGCKAMEMLMKLLNNEPLDKRQIVLDNQLLIRASSGIPINTSSY